jgi:hypothetical protein
MQHWEKVAVAVAVFVRVVTVFAMYGSSSISGSRIISSSAAIVVENVWRLFR